jgi:hypothetical protein
MSKPYFLIIGAQRAGTTSLWNYLRSCPQLTPAIPTDEYWFEFPDGRIGKYWPTNQPLKESRFFTYLYDGENIDVYENLFSDDKTGFEASIEYLHCPGVAERIKGVYDDLKFIVMLRDPVARAWSQYWHEVNFNKGEALPFEEAILRQPSSLEDYYFRAYLKTGHYAEHLKRWFDLFGRDNFFIIQSEQFYKNPDYWFKSTQAFLGLNPIIGLQDYSNFGINQKYPAMDAGTKALLNKYFEPHNENLYKML